MSTNSSTSSPSLKGLISPKPLLTYFVASYVFFSLVIATFAGLIAGLGLRPATVPSWSMTLVVVVGSWMPALAAVIVTGTLEGGTGIRTLFAKWMHLRLPVRWYLATLIPLGLAFGAVAIYELIGGSGAGMTVTVGAVAGLIVTSMLQGPTGEELGWRGFALPRMLQRQNPLRGAIVLGLLWDGWHLPLWLTTMLALIPGAPIFGGGTSDPIYTGVAVLSALVLVLFLRSVGTRAAVEEKSPAAQGRDTRLGRPELR